MQLCLNTFAFLHIDFNAETASIYFNAEIISIDFNAKITPCSKLAQNPFGIAFVTHSVRITSVWTTSIRNHYILSVMQICALKTHPESHMCERLSLCLRFYGVPSHLTGIDFLLTCNWSTVKLFLTCIWPFKLHQIVFAFLLSYIRKQVVLRLEMAHIPKACYLGHGCNEHSLHPMWWSRVPPL